MSPKGARSQSSPPGADLLSRPASAGLSGETGLPQEGHRAQWEAGTAVECNAWNKRAASWVGAGKPGVPQPSGHRRGAFPGRRGVCHAVIFLALKCLHVLKKKKKKKNHRFPKIWGSLTVSMQILICDISKLPSYITMSSSRVVNSFIRGRRKMVCLEIKPPWYQAGLLYITRLLTQVF